MLESPKVLISILSKFVVRVSFSYSTIPIFQLFFFFFFFFFCSFGKMLQKSISTYCLVKSNFRLKVTCKRWFTSYIPTKRYRLLFLGAPGVGKGTFAKRISPVFNAQIMTSGQINFFFYFIYLIWLCNCIFDTGDLCRTASKTDEKIKNYINHGQLIPDDIKWC